MGRYNEPDAVFKFQKTLKWNFGAEIDKALPQNFFGEYS